MSYYGPRLGFGVPPPGFPPQIPMQMQMPGAIPMSMPMPMSMNVPIPPIPLPPVPQQQQQHRAPMHISAQPQLNTNSSNNNSGSNSADLPVAPQTTVPEKPSIDKATSAFIAKIPDWLSDEWIVDCLNQCGSLRSWTRVTSPHDPKVGLTFGFATFDSPAGIHNLLHALARERQTTPIRVKKHALLFKVDMTARKAVADYMARTHADATSNPLEAVRKIKEEDTRCAEQVNAFLKRTGMWDESDNVQVVAENTAITNSNLTGVAAAADKSNSEMDLDKTGNDVDTFLGSLDAATSSTNKVGSKRIHEELTEEEERQRLERREREMHQAYLERVARFERQEVTRIRNIEAAQKKLYDAQAKKLRDHEGMAELLRNWDDDDPELFRDEEFYRDRARWIHKRNPNLRREQELDSRDRFAELEEREKLHAQELESTRGERERLAQLKQQEEEAAARALEEQERIDKLRRERELEMAERAKEVYHAVPSGGHGIVVGRIMTMEERKKAIEELVGSLPTGLEDICGWEVKWDFLEGGGGVVANKIKAFVVKKVVEILNEDNPDITEFVMSSIAKRKSAGYILDELTGPLDEDAEVFVKKLWRMVMYESESRARG
ncbi:hypothetical protein HK100_010726, partial [Physocladia obscura]